MWSNSKNSINMNFKNEKELELKIRKDLSHYFQIPQGQKAGKDRYDGRKVLPDIACFPIQYAQHFDLNFCVEVKLLHEDKKRRELAEGYWQAYEQLHHTDYKDYSFDFALVATQYSYKDVDFEELANFLYSCMRIFGRKNVGWLDMKSGAPVMWMSSVTTYTNQYGTWKPRCMWSAAAKKPIDLKQLSLRNGSKLSNKHTNEN